MKITKEEEAIRASLLKTGKNITALQEKLPELEELFDKFFKDGLRMSNVVQSFLETNVEV